MPVKSRGIDVSEANGIIDWKKVADSGIKFAMLRAGGGSSPDGKDSMFDENYEKAKAAGIRLGCYWDCQALDRNEPRKEAIACLECIKGKTFERPVFYKITNETQIKKGKFIVNAMIKDFKNRLYGYKTGVFMYWKAAKSYLDSVVLKMCPLWIICAEEEHDCPGNVVIWQHTKFGSVDGITGPVALDYVYLKRGEFKKPSLILHSGTYTYSLKQYRNIKFSAHLYGRDFACRDINGKLQSENFITTKELVLVIERIGRKLKCNDIKILSAYRTVEYNYMVYGQKVDYHTKGKAADVVFYDKDNNPIPAKTVCLCVEDYGHTGGIGYMNKFAVHIDVGSKQRYFIENDDDGIILVDSFYDYWNVDSYLLKTKTTTKLKLRNCASTAGKVIDIIDKNTEVFVYEDNEWGWSYIGNGALKGWMQNRHLESNELSKFKTVSFGKKITARVRPNKNAETDGVYIVGQQMQLLSVLGSEWLHVITEDNKTTFLPYDKTIVNICE